MVQTCRVCETICYLVEVSNHECLKGYGCYVDAATRYFYPLLSIYFIFYKCILFCCAYISKLNIFFIYDGKTCLRRAYINGVEQIVEAEIDATFSQDIRKLWISWHNNELFCSSTMKLNIFLFDFSRGRKLSIGEFQLSI